MNFEEMEKTAEEAFDLIDARLSDCFGGYKHLVRDKTNKQLLRALLALDDGREYIEYFTRFGDMATPKEAQSFIDNFKHTLDVLKECDEQMGGDSIKVSSALEKYTAVYNAISRLCSEWQGVTAQ